MKIHFNKIEINISDNKKTIFYNLKKEGYILNHSCLTGRCSECKVKVKSGSFEMKNEQEGLTEKEINEGYCLACVTNPTSSLKLAEINFIERELPEVKIIPAKISNLNFLSKDIAEVTLRTPSNKKLNFIAGQYINLSIGNIKRSYSLASIPADHNVKLIIKNYKNGQFSNYLFNNAKENDLLRIEGPLGTYILPKKITQNIVLISTSTGIAPNISILLDALNEKKINSNKVILIHGQRFVNEHIYNLEEVFKYIEIIKVVSREKRKGFFTGYIQDVLLTLDLDWKETTIFACGNPNMVSESKKLLISEGLKENNFKSDIFVATN